MNESDHAKSPIVLQTGFRIFFLGAAVYTVASMALWLWFYVALGLFFPILPFAIWHAHEMIFGYSMAVIAGFLLTAVTNWTNLPTLRGLPLLCLFLCWACARVLSIVPVAFAVWPMAMFDTAFALFLIIGIAKPIFAAKQWRQSAILAKLIVILISGTAFYVAFFNANFILERKALRFAVYMIVSLILTVGRRIMPFFIERGVGYPVQLRNHLALDYSSLVLLVAFSILDVFFVMPKTVSVLAAVLALVHGVRLAGWHTVRIWKKPLLWVLFIGYLFLIAGFALKAALAWRGLPDDAALHAFTAGGIGLFTLGMMARVSWGHTGRDIAQAPGRLSLIFVSLALGAAIRTFFPLLHRELYVLWIAISQVLWIFAFVLYLIFYYKILTSPRADGKFG